MSIMGQLVNTVCNGKPFVGRKPAMLSKDEWEFLCKRGETFNGEVIVCTTCGSDCGQCGSRSNGMELDEFRKWYAKVNVPSLHRTNVPTISQSSSKRT